ncbi:aldo/keto reductase [Stutzerimonas tarimensis]|uniref:Aldo/keto reductase n=1 Tax=Stutzerimonas tarimensis TaxID=1507735 RepID=A0ABV7T0F7_9GAMM
MQTRRQFLQHMATLAAMASLYPATGWGAEQDLLQRPIPSTGEQLPVIGLGTSRTFNVPLTDEPLQPLLQVMRHFTEGGASLIDTSPSYGNAERVTGELARRLEVGEQIFYATKISTMGQAAGQKQVETSFEVLGTDQIDLIQVHNLQDTANHLAYLRELKQEGRIRYVGVTHYLDSAHGALLEVLKEEPVDFVQFNYSVASRNAEKQLLPYCRDNGIATLINRPFLRGELFDKVRDEPLPGFAEELGATSWAQLMLKFILAEPAVTAIIPATSNPRYMLDNLMAGRGPLPDAAQREQIDRMFR